MMTASVPGTGPEVTCPSQSFRISNTSRTCSVIKIDARLDHTIGQYVVLWRDIQRVFENAQYAKQGDSVVSFMSDDAFEELSPPRILCRPGIVLDIVLKDTIDEPLSRQQTEPTPLISQQLTEADSDNNSRSDSDDKTGLQTTLRYLPESLASIRDLLQTLVDRTHEQGKDLFHDKIEIKPRVDPMDLPEVRNLVFQYLDRKDFVKCMLFNKAWHEWSAPMVWGTLMPGGDPHRNPPTKAFARYSHLTRVLILQPAIPDLSDYSTLYFLNLQRLTLTLSAESVKSMCTLIYRHTYLKELDLTLPYTGLGRLPLDPSPLWKAICSLPNLETLHLHNIEVRCFSFELLELRRLRHLTLHYWNSDTIGEQILFLSRCPSLEVLDWYPTQVYGEFRHYEERERLNATDAENFVWMVERRTWPKLEGLIIRGYSLNLSDEHIARILVALPRVTNFGMRNSAFGELSFQRLRAHFLTLKELDLYNCLKATEEMLLEIVSSCSRLSRICQTDLFDIISQYGSQNDSW